MDTNASANRTDSRPTTIAASSLECLDSILNDCQPLNPEHFRALESKIANLEAIIVRQTKNINESDVQKQEFALSIQEMGKNYAALQHDNQMWKQQCKALVSARVKFENEEVNMLRLAYAEKLKECSELNLEVATRQNQMESINQILQKSFHSKNVLSTEKQTLEEELRKATHNFEKALQAAQILNSKCKALQELEKSSNHRFKQLKSEFDAQSAELSSLKNQQIKLLALRSKEQSRNSSSENFINSKAFQDQISALKIDLEKANTVVQKLTSNNALLSCAKDALTCKLDREIQSLKEAYSLLEKENEVLLHRMNSTPKSKSEISTQTEEAEISKDFKDIPESENSITPNDWSSTLHRIRDKLLLKSQTEQKLSKLTQTDQIEEEENLRREEFQKQIEVINSKLPELQVKLADRQEILSELKETRRKLEKEKNANDALKNENEASKKKIKELGLTIFRLQNVRSLSRSSCKLSSSPRKMLNASTNTDEDENKKKSYLESLTYKYETLKGNASRYKTKCKELEVGNRRLKSQLEDLQKPKLTLNSSCNTTENFEEKLQAVKKELESEEAKSNAIRKLCVSYKSKCQSLENENRRLRESLASSMHENASYNVGFVDTVLMNAHPVKALHYTIPCDTNTPVDNIEPRRSIQKRKSQSFTVLKPTPKRPSVQFKIANQLVKKAKLQKAHRVFSTTCNDA